METAKKEIEMVESTTPAAKQELDTQAATTNVKQEEKSDIKALESDQKIIEEVDADKKE